VPLAKRSIRLVAHVSNAIVVWPRSPEVLDLAMQCAAIPYRTTEAGNLEILLVTSRGKGNWILPKGNVKPGKSAAISAQEEAYEEAGAHGIVDQALVARYDLPDLPRSAGTVGDQMQIFSMEVVRVAPIWPEMFQRRRRWASLQDAMDTIKGAHFREALRTFAAIMAPVV
jgi:8-oxo-dGTP pyrophosphatase MutT (NUDIX family)